MAEAAAASDIVMRAPVMKAMRRRAAEPPVEEVGARLRAMMPWIRENRLVDESRN